MSYFFKIVGVKGQQITCELSSIKCYSQNKYTWEIMWGIMCNVWMRIPCHSSYYTQGFSGELALYVQNMLTLRFSLPDVDEGFSLLPSTTATSK